MLQALEEILKKGKVDIKGHANILASFPFNNKKVAGSKVVDGKFTKGDPIILMRGDKEIGKARAASIKKQKQDVGQVAQGDEFGMILEPQLAFEIGDVLLSVAR